jgi:PKD repeat protein
MKKKYILLITFLFIVFEINSQTIINEGFESGILNPAISFQSTGSFSSSPGIINNTNFESTKVFSFGKSTCGSSCFDNYKTTLIVTFPSPTLVDSIKWKEMEIDGNWGSQGKVLLDDVVFGGATLGAMPVNSTVPNSTPQLKAISINQMVTTIKFMVNDITNASEIIMDDLQIKYTLTPKIVGYEYWFNDDFANKTTTAVTSTQQLMINQTIPTTGLMQGINTINFRSFDNSGKYSSIISHFFYKTSLTESNQAPEIVAYEYWIDNDYANAVIVNTPVQQQLNINELMSMTTLNNGVHNFHIRFKDDAGLWSSVVSHFFYKTPEQIVTQNSITEYRYWFNNDFANAVNLSLTPNQQINLMDNLDLTQVSKGIHEVNFQFKDTLGRWSVVLTDIIEKIALPIADFSYSAMPYCDSTVVTFTDNSIDGDEYLWDFGDGNTSDLANPTHTYYTPDTYQVSLTVTDITLGTDSTIVIPVVINSLHTSSTITETACVSYTAPDGQIYITSGIKTAIIPNAAGCDSTITINLTINSVDVSVNQNGIILSANATADFYQWVDCNNGNSIINGETNQSFTATQNGSFAVKITQNGCTDTSACYTVTTVGILENTFSNDIIVYPNPTDGIVKIDLGKTLSEFSVSLTDVNGKLINQTSYKNTKMIELNLNAQPGIYLLTIYSENKKATIRLIKN